jgi:cyclopropane-fatty-acyl-phospholipid synthase
MVAAFLQHLFRKVPPMSLASLLDKVVGRPAVSADDAAEIVRRLFTQHPYPAFAVRLWDGRHVSFGPPARFTLSFDSPQTFARCVGSGDPSELAEAYVDRRVCIDGDLREAVKLLSYLGTIDLDWGSKLSVASKLGYKWSKHTIQADTSDVQAHYDLSDDFFRLFLDDRMVYSCAYFTDEHETLDDAQAHKLDLVCRKLRLQPGDSFLDIGCGWGALVLWAAEHYGVIAHGITLSAHQAAEARRRAEKSGLSDRVTIDERHYAELPSDVYDKVASVGMYEHVGVGKLPAYFHAVHDALKAGGLFLNHGITAPANRPALNGGTFIGRHVFPGGELDGVPHLQDVMEHEGFEIVDVESLRRHYALTLSEWYRRFKSARQQAARVVTDRVIRAWDLYLAGCAHAFAEGMLGIHQVLAAKPDHGRIRLPLTREDLLLTR